MSLLDAMYRDDFDEFTRLLDAGVDMDIVEHGESVVERAMFGKHERFLDELLKRGALTQDRMIVRANERGDRDDAYIEALYKNLRPERSIWYKCKYFGTMNFVIDALYGNEHDERPPTRESMVLGFKYAYPLLDSEMDRESILELHISRSALVDRHIEVLAEAGIDVTKIPRLLRYALQVGEPGIARALVAAGIPKKEAYDTELLRSMKYRNALAREF